MRVLVACEYSGVVRDAFIARGHDALSADLLPTEAPGPHYLGDARDVLGDGWDLLIAHPPCTYLTRAGERWFHDTRPSTPECLRGADRLAAMREAVDLFLAFLDAPVPRVAVENPAGMVRPARDLLGDRARPNQVVQPWEHGHGDMKATGLWTRRLPPLMPTDLTVPRRNSMWLLPPTDDRAHLRSRTYDGIAAAMADQWGTLPALEVAS